MGTSRESDGRPRMVARARAMHELLARQGVRIFALSSDPNDAAVTHWIHDAKTVEQWREDVRGFLAAAPVTDADGWASDKVFNALSAHLDSLGYLEVDDVVADVFEGRITNESARFVDAPAHEDQPDGFGHYGWESK